MVDADPMKIPPAQNDQDETKKPNGDPQGNTSKNIDSPEITNNVPTPLMADPESNPTAATPLTTVPDPIPPPRSRSPFTRLNQNLQARYNKCPPPVRQFLHVFRENLHPISTLTLYILAVVIARIVVENHTLDFFNKNDRTVYYCRFLGNCFLDMFKGLTLPLLVAGLVTSMGTMDLLLLKKIGGSGAASFMAYNLLASTLGTVLVAFGNPAGFIKPMSVDIFQDHVDKNLVQDQVLDLARNLIPSNIMEASLSRVFTSYGCVDIDMPCDVRYDDYEGIRACCFEIKVVEVPNFMGLTVFSVVLGTALAKSGLYGRPVLALFQSIVESTLVIVTWVLQLVPVATFSLALADVMQIRPEVHGHTLLYLATVSVALFLMAGTYPLVYFFITRKNPWVIIRALGPAFLSAATTSSSLVTVPIMWRCLEAVGVHKRVSRVLVPLGTRIHLTGTTLYLAVSANYVVDAVGISHHPFILRPSILLGSSFFSMGAIGVPSGSEPQFQTLLRTVGLEECIAFFYPIEVIVDSLRTMVNILGTAMVTAMISHLYHDELHHQQSYEDYVAEMNVMEKLTLSERLTSPLDDNHLNLRQSTGAPIIQDFLDHHIEAGYIETTTNEEHKVGKKKTKKKLRLRSRRPPKKHSRISTHSTHSKSSSHKSKASSIKKQRRVKIQLPRRSTLNAH